ncbi:hypothetical protein [Novosphingobium sp.]|uniref:hypothetical protein n=1 Tax=Novosphingobium sp. TaxID=1874826 RepID=UPI0025DD1629|nr:hypothetical protein [Novosphingobium sp.]
MGLRHVGLLCTFALSGCGISGGGEDFAVDTKASPAVVAAALSKVSFDTHEMLFGKLPIVRERPEEGALRWIIESSSVPGTKEDPAIIALRLEPLGSNGSTRIHATIDVPEVRIMMGEANKVLSEAKVETEFRKLIEKLTKHLDARSDTTADVDEIGSLLGAVAVSANTSLQARANYIKKDLAGELGSVGRGDSAADREYADRPYEDRFDSRGNDSQAQDESYGDAEQ